MLVQLIPSGLIALYLISIVLLRHGRGAILLGNWFRHRNFMLPAIMLAAITIALSVVFFALAGLPDFTQNALVRLTGWALLLVHLAAMAGLIVLLPWTLYRVARHLLLPHKIMARWTIRIWNIMAASGMAVNGLLLTLSIMG